MQINLKSVLIHNHSRYSLPVSGQNINNYLRLRVVKSHCGIKKAIDLLPESLLLNPTLTLYYRNLSIIQSGIGTALEGQKDQRQTIILKQLIQPHLLKRPVTNH